MGSFFLGVLTYALVDFLVGFVYRKWIRYQRRKYKEQCREYDRLIGDEND